MTSKKENTFVLKELKTEKSFQVPEGYFEAFPDRLQARINENKKAETKKTIFRTYFTPQLAMAASFIGLMVIAYSGIKFVVNKPDFKSGSENTVIADLPDYSLYDLDETMLYEVYNEASSDKNSLRSSETNITDEMIDYLVLEDADIEVLMQEL